MNSCAATSSQNAVPERKLDKPPSAKADPVTISFYENEVPDFVGPELERLYANLFSTLPQFAFRDAGALHTYVAYRGMERTAVLLFELKGAMIRVLNEGIRIDEEELVRFAHAAFARYASAKAIRLHAVEGDITSHSFPWQQHPVLQDIVLKLPKSSENYLASLGKSTRSYLNRYLNKIRREHPSFRHEVLIGEEINESLVLELISMHKARMASKDKVSVIDDKRLREILQLAKEFGFAVIARVEGNICGGTINYRVGENYFLETVAHDSSFNDYRIGTICSYLTVCECIARSGREYHFLWGDYDYKFRLGGVRRELNDLYLYRSRLHMVLNSDFTLTMAAKCYLLQLKRRLQQEAVPQDTLRSRAACKALRLLQKGKRVINPCK